MKQTKQTWMIAALLLCMSTLQAQIPGYIPGDENYTLTLAFHKIDTLMVVIPHNYSITDREKTDIENYVFWDQYQKKPVYVYKKETELTPADSLRHLQFYGPFHKFKLPEIQNIPFKQVEGGFSFNNEIFDKHTDSFFYLNNDSTRLYTCRNSTQVWHQYVNLAAGYFPLYIFRGTELYLSGYSSNKAGQFRINNITQMRQSYFESIKTRFFDFEVAKTLYTDSLREVISEQADSYLETLCDGIKVDTLNLNRITTCIYKNMADLQQFLSMSPRMTIYGKSIGSTNHVSSFDMTVFNHETAHTIIGQKIGFQPNSFFCEGFAVYTGYLMKDNGYYTDLDSTKIHLDLLTEEIIIGDDHRFYSLPPMYPISGVFTRFIIDKIGIEKFKTFYAQDSIENAFSENGFPLSNLITEFKNEIGNAVIEH